MSTTTPFGADYAGHYDLFYAQKDYAAECDFLETLFARFTEAPVRRILDLGCGTGGHAWQLAQRGYTVLGVDRSAAMLEQAQRKAAHANPDTLSFSQGDVRTVQLNQQFDAVIMMFAVLGYQVSNADLAGTLATVRRHLRPGGLLVADFWYGPAVLRHGPSDRIHEHQVNGMGLLRLAQARMNTLEHRVDVRYRILQIQGQQVTAETEEEHAMRFFFPQELHYMASVAGLHLRHLGPCLALDAPLTDDTWNATAVFEALPKPEDK